MGVGVAAFQTGFYGFYANIAFGFSSKVLNLLFSLLCNL